MNYILSHSLQHTAVVKVAVMLWNVDDVKNLLSEFNYDNDAKFQSLSWQKIEAIVAEKVAQLPLPKQMKEKISCFIRPVGLQIKQWKHYLYNDCHLRLDLPNEFCWTSQGTIDRKKTADVMIKHEDIDIITRYSLACIHCLEDDIPKLWDKIPKSRRISLYNTADNYVLPLVEIWTYYIKKDMRKINRMIKQAVGCKKSVYKYAAEIAIHDGHTVAAEYFLEKLTVGEIDLEWTAEDVAAEDLLGDNYAEVLCSLLSYLDKRGQIRVFRNISPRFLASLLDYPFQHFFMGTAYVVGFSCRQLYVGEQLCFYVNNYVNNYMWDFLEEKDYVFVLDGIVFKIKDGYKDFDYQKLFGEIWQKIPFYHKRYILTETILYSTIRDLFKIGDEDNIRLIFQDATPAGKKRLFYHDIAQNICKNLLNDDDSLSLLKYFITQCLPSKGEVIGFKELLENGEVGEFQFKFIRVLDEVIDEFKKRKHEEDDNNKAKKVCSVKFKDMTQCIRK